MNTDSVVIPNWDEALFAFENEITDELENKAKKFQIQITRKIEVIPTDAEVLDSVDELDQKVYDLLVRQRSRLTLPDYYIGSDIN